MHTHVHTETSEKGKDSKKDLKGDRKGTSGKENRDGEQIGARETGQDDGRPMKW